MHRYFHVIVGIFQYFHVFRALDLLEYFSLARPKWIVGCQDMAVTSSVVMQVYACICMYL